MELSERQVTILRECIEVQERDRDKQGWMGFLWSEVHAPTITLNALVAQGLLNISEFSSRKYTYYSVNDMDRARKIIDAYDEDNLPSEDEFELIVPNDLFDIVVGHDQTRNLLKMSIMASDPVHVLLLGDPASGKTLFLNELGRLPGSRFALGGTSSRAGIIDFLIELTPPSFIIN